MNEWSFESHVVEQLKKLDSLAQMAEKIDQLERRTSAIEKDVREARDFSTSSTASARNNAGWIAFVTSLITAVAASVATSLFGHAPK